MVRGTTPTLILKLNTDLDVGNMKQIWVTFKSIMNEVTLSKNDIRVINESDLIISLSQEQTLKFTEGIVSVQVRLLTPDNKAYATKIKTINMSNVLKEGVIM
ncbi:MAG: hypothetical protein J6T10_22600 [Methanobrevibacter sp.]|nr:hypothetical protein [Methanobrevibacter sp.]